MLAYCRLLNVQIRLKECRLFYIRNKNKQGFIIYWFFPLKLAEIKKAKNQFFAFAFYQ